MKIYRFRISFLLILFGNVLSSLGAEPSTNALGKIVLIGISRPPHPIGVILADQRFSPPKCYILAAGESTNGITVVRIDTTQGIVELSLGGQTNAIALPSTNADKNQDGKKKKDAGGQPSGGAYVLPEAVKTSAHP